MKNNKLLQIATIMIAIILICLISFAGIYVKEKNKMVNVLPDYQFATDLKGNRTLTLKVDKTTKEEKYDKDGNKITDESKIENEEEVTTKEIVANPPDVLNLTNYQICKTILENRLVQMGVSPYSIKNSMETGEFYIEIPENSQTDYVIENLSSSGKFEILDAQTNEVLMNNQDIEKAWASYASESAGTRAYLIIEFTADGAKKLENISNTYVETEDEEGNKTQKKISLKIDDSEIVSTYFGSTLSNGTLQLSVGQATTSNQELQTALLQASNMANLLQNGKMPIKYVAGQNQYILSDINTEVLKIVACIGVVIYAIAIIYQIIRYKEYGLLAAFANVIVPAILLILLRYTNVLLSIESVLAIGFITILHYWIIGMIMKKVIVYVEENTKDSKKVKIGEMKSILKPIFIKMFFYILPAFIIAITFSFMSWNSINSFGMVLFWGLVTIVMCNLAITRTFILNYSETINNK